MEYARLRGVRAADMSYSNRREIGYFERPPFWGRRPGDAKRRRCARDVLIYKRAFEEGLNARLLRLFGLVAETDLKAARQTEEETATENAEEEARGVCQVKGGRQEGGRRQDGQLGN